MTFQPVLAGDGLAGWAALKHSLQAQQARLATRPEMARDAAYFRDRIGAVGTAEALVADRRLLSVALQAFGLEGDLNNRAFLRKVLEEGTLKADALANRLADRRYGQLAAAFGFGDFSVPRTRLSGFADEILSKRTERQFEVAVGQRDTRLRLALDADRSLAALANGRGSEGAKWFEVMGNPPLRQVVEQALNLPKSVVALDLDRQRALFRDRAGALFGNDTVAQFADPARRDALIRRFLLTPDAGAAPAPPALTLLAQGRAMFRRL
jgi:hypothetical protein